MNLIFAELISSSYGIAVDITAAIQHGWKLGSTVCHTTGFLLTLSGKLFLEIFCSMLKEGIRNYEDTLCIVLFFICFQEFKVFGKSKCSVFVQLLIIWCVPYT